MQLRNLSLVELGLPLSFGGDFTIAVNGAPVLDLALSLSDIAAGEAFYDVKVEVVMPRVVTAAVATYVRNGEAGWGVCALGCVMGVCGGRRWRGRRLCRRPPSVPAALPGSLRPRSVPQSPSRCVALHALIYAN